MDTGSIIALVFGCITVLITLAAGAVYVGKLIAAIDRMNETIKGLEAVIKDHETKIEFHGNRLDRLEEAAG